MADETGPPSGAGPTSAESEALEDSVTATPPAPSDERLPDTAADGPGGRPNRRKVREGLVVSNTMDKTAVVAVIERVRHPRYAKTVQRTKRLYVHDEGNQLRIGDRVRLSETRPQSKLKRWRIVQILERAK
jgi:small subunit ribosomal protein S17